ncbi:MAG: hypothetical protein IKM31_01665 [Oscillospiraceae bacterium]|nr:hypothetical protein [Oscillospiraceae bacterium]
MKRIILTAVLFAAVFAGSYLAMCYLVPGFRIKLDADAFTYFIESVNHMALFKTIISLAAGAVVCGLAAAIPKLRR